MKDKIINLRIPAEIKNSLQTISNQSGHKLSKITRDAIDFYLKENRNIENSEFEPKLNDDFNLLKSFEFTKLVFWIMEKKTDNMITSIINDLKYYLSTIEKILINRYFSTEIKQEFRKVHNELKEYLTQTHSYQISFDFPILFRGFNYRKFAVFMSTLRYSEDGVVMIYI